MSSSDFEAALRKTTVISGPAAFTVASPNAAVAISGSMPEADAGRELVVAVTGSTQTFQLSSLAGKDAAAAAITLTDANSVKWMAGTVTYRLGHTAAGGFVASASTAGTYTITLTDSRIDLEGWARLNGGQIPANRLPNGGGLTQGQVDARIEPFARAGTTTRVPESHLPTDLDHLLDALADGGWSTEGNNAAEDAWIAQVASPTKPTIGAARGYTYASATWERTGSTITPAWLTVRVPAGLKDEVAAGNLRLIADYNNDPDDMGDIAVSSGWRHVGNSRDDAYWYYIQRFTGVPAGTNIVQRYTRFRIDRTKLDTGVPVETAEDEGAVLTRGADGPVWKQLQRLHGLKALHDRSTELAFSLNAIWPPSPQTLTLFGPSAFDLDEHHHRAGEFHVDLAVRILTRSASNIGWGEGGAKLNDGIAGLTFASAVAAADAFVSGGVVKGVEIGNIDLYKGTVKQGVLRFYLGRDGSNQAGYLLDYQPKSGASSTDNITIEAHLDVSFMPADGGVGAKIATYMFPPDADSYDANWHTILGTWTIEDARYERSDSNEILRVPRVLPGTQSGFYAVVKVGSATVSTFFLPWTLVAARSSTSPSTGVHVEQGYFMTIPHDDQDSHSVLLVVQRQAVINYKDAIYFRGCNNNIPANVTVELYEWTA